MAKWYAVECHVAVTGKRLFWSDSFNSIQLARKTAKSLRNDYGNAVTIKILAENPRPIGHVIGVSWKEVETV